MPKHLVVVIFALGLLACAKSTTASRQDGNNPALDAKVEASEPPPIDAVVADCNGGQPFADPIVEAGVRAELDKPNGPFTTEELDRVTTLVADGAVSLEGVQCLPSLEVLVATRGAISDLSPLEDLVNLRSAVLFSNRIRSLLPLSEHYSLQSIAVADNQIDSLEGLVLGETTCSTFEIQGNPIGSTDVQPFCDLGWVVTWGGAGTVGDEQCNLLCL